jgi:ankyrin repeat protein
MATIEEVKLTLINSDYDALKEALNDFDINSFDSSGNNILHHYLLSIKRIEIEPKLVLDLFVSKGIDIDQKQVKGGFKRSPLHISVFSKQKEITDYLINKGADINSTDDNGNNILSTAISRFNFGENGGYFIEKLIEVGGDMNHENNHGISAKTWALRYDKNDDARKCIPESILE